MKIYSTTFKDVSGICAETETLKAVFLPQYGAKLASLIYKEDNYEILAQDENKVYLPQSKNSVYIENEVSAVDDLFPTIDPCRTGFADNAEYPCHGETLRFPHKYSINENTLTMEFVSETFGYKFTKLVKEGECGGITVAYAITNLSDADFPCIFGLHCMLAAEKGGKVLTFEKPGDAVMMFDEDGQFGKPLQKVALSDKMLVSDAFDENGNAYKYYLCKEKTTGKCGYYNPAIRKNIILSYDGNALPYLGIWMNNGKFKGMYNAALEPCTAPYDSPVNAKEKGYNFIIGKGETYSAEITFTAKDSVH